MAYQRGDYRYGNQYRSQDRWRDRERGSRYGSGQGYREDDDRGFFDRAGDEVRSWFGDEEAERRRDRDVRQWEREQRALGDRSRTGSAFGGGSYGSGFDRTDDEYPKGDYGQDTSYVRRPSYDRPADTWGGSGFGGYEAGGRRFDRIDAGSTGTHGAHPMSSAAGCAHGAR